MGLKMWLISQAIQRIKVFCNAQSQASLQSHKKKTQHKADAEFPTAVKQLIALMYVRFLAFGYQVWTLIWYFWT